MEFFEARERHQAAMMSREDLVTEVYAKNYLERDKPVTAAVIAITLASKRRSESMAREKYKRNLGTGSDTPIHPYFNLLRTCIYLERLKEVLEEEGRNAVPRNSTTEFLQHRDVTLRSDDYPREFPHMSTSHGPSIERGAPSSYSVPFGGGGSGARGAKLLSVVAKRPNPSSTGASKGLATYTYNNGLPMSKNMRIFEGDDPLNEEPAKQRCVVCNIFLPLLSMKPLEAGGYICLSCHEEQHHALSAIEPLHGPGKGSKSGTRVLMALQDKEAKRPSQKRLRPLNSGNFYGDSSAASQQPFGPRLPAKKQNQKLEFPKLKVAVVGGADLELRPKTVFRQVKAKAVEGTEGNPISLDDSDDEPIVPSPEANGNGKKDSLLPESSGAMGARKRRATRVRSSSGQHGALAAERLAGLRGMLPLTGGVGAVVFTAADYARLGPEEMLNDTAIDLYLRYIQIHLEAHNPAALKRCYFFNSFFFKKLTEKGGHGAQGQTAAEKNYNKLKKWTKDVDIFEKDYIFVPIHDHMHWSLIIICHPGAESESCAQIQEQTLNKPRLRSDDGADVVILDASPKKPVPKSVARGTDGDGEEHPLAAPKPAPFFLHLDSLGKDGGHSASPITRALKSYLDNEWRSKAQNEAPSVPRKWAEIHLSEEKSFAKMPVRKPHVPQQDNHCDCGLFVCAFTEYFVGALPPALNPESLLALNRSHGVHDLWETRSAGEEGSTRCLYPGFLTEHWFTSSNASRLRWELSMMVVRGMAQSEGLMSSEEPYRWLLDQAAASGKSEQLEALLEELESLQRLQDREGKYLRPDEWRPQAESNKLDRIRTLERRHCEQGRSKMGSQRLLGTDDDDLDARSSQRELLATAAERRKRTRGISSKDLDRQPPVKMRTADSSPDSQFEMDLGDEMPPIYSGKALNQSKAEDVDLEGETVEVGVPITQPERYVGLHFPLKDGFDEPSPSASADFGGEIGQDAKLMHLSKKPTNQDDSRWEETFDLPRPEAHRHPSPPRGRRQLIEDTDNDDEDQLKPINNVACLAEGNDDAQKQDEEESLRLTLIDPQFHLDDHPLSADPDSPPAPPRDPSKPMTGEEYVRRGFPPPFLDSATRVQMRIRDGPVHGEQICAISVDHWDPSLNWTVEVRGSIETMHTVRHVWLPTWESGVPSSCVWDIPKDGSMKTFSRRTHITYPQAAAPITHGSFMGVTEDAVAVNGGHDDGNRALYGALHGDRIGKAGVDGAESRRARRRGVQGLGQLPTGAQTEHGHKLKGILNKLKADMAGGPSNRNCMDLTAE